MKTILKYIFSALLLATGIFLTLHIFKSHQTKKEIDCRIQSLQHCCFESLSGGQMCIDEFNPDQPTIIMYFHPECEHCQYESGEIGRQKEQFEKVNMILITPDNSVKRVEAFARRYHLWEIDNLTILLDQNNRFKSHFGTQVVPTLIIYGLDKKLLVMFKGEVQMKAVIKAVKTL